MRLYRTYKMPQQYFGYGTETYSLYANDQGNGLTSYGLASEILKNLLSQLGTKDKS